MTRFSAAVVAVIAVSCSRPPSATTVKTTRDEAGTLRQVSISKEKDGRPNIDSYMDGTKFLRIEIDQNEDGRIDRWEYYSADGRLEKVGFSRAGDGVVDAWAFQSPEGVVSRVEVSTLRDGRVNRVELYEAGILKRAEEDTNRDGRVDKWETYERGSLVSAAFDTTGTGRPDYVIDYRKEQTPPG